jgi:hypothetical protein
MQDLFPEEVAVPYGLVHTRLICGLPVWVFALLLACGVAPLYLWGWRKWWVSALAIGAGWLVTLGAQDDPEFLQAVQSEFTLRDYYD